MPLFYHMERFRAPHTVRMSPMYVIKNIPLAVRTRNNDRRIREYVFDTS